MADLILALVPLMVGVVMTPLAIIALVAVLLSQRARANGVAFVIGWALAVIVILGVSSLVLALLHIDDKADPPTWVSILRLVVAAVLILGAAWIVRRGRREKMAMARASTPREVAEAAPQLPGVLQKVDTFTPGRSLALGFGIFALNPVDASCAILAALDVRVADVSSTEAALAIVLFAVVSIVPIAVPVILLLTKGAQAQPVLSSIRRWIATNTSLLNAAVLVVIASLQLQKALSALIG